VIGFESAPFFAALPLFLDFFLLVSNRGPVRSVSPGKGRRRENDRFLCGTLESFVGGGAKVARRPQIHSYKCQLFFENVFPGAALTRRCKDFTYRAAGSGQRRELLVQAVVPSPFSLVRVPDECLFHFCFPAPPPSAAADEVAPFPPHTTGSERQGNSESTCCVDIVPAFVSRDAGPKYRRSSDQQA